MTSTEATLFRTGDTPTPDTVILTHHLTREYVMGAEVVHALRGVDIKIKKNEFVACMGPSGSGKSTLMNLIGCLDTPTAGEYWLNGQKVSDLSDDELARIRNKEIGFVFQPFNLLPRADALPLAARELVGPVIHTVPQAHLFERASGALAPLLGSHAGVDERQLDVVERRGPGQQVEGLEDEANFLVSDVGQLVVVHLAHLLAVELVAAFAGRIEATDEVHQRRLARP
jgi:hypothetical protein